MGSTPDATLTILKLVAVLILVLANGFFVAAEFALVSMRRSRVKELVAERRANAKALQKATDSTGGAWTAASSGKSANRVGSMLSTAQMERAFSAEMGMPRSARWTVDLETPAASARCPWLMQFLLRSAVRAEAISTGSMSSSPFESAKPRIAATLLTGPRLGRKRG